MLSHLKERADKIIEQPNVPKKTSIEVLERKEEMSNTVHQMNVVVESANEIHNIVEM